MSEATEDYPEWRVQQSYRTGDKVAYLGKCYQCRQAHTSNPDWVPNVSFTLWQEISPA